MKTKDPTLLFAWYRAMLTIRYFETRVEQLFSKGVIRGTTHPATGQEAVAVGACAAMRKGDFITSTHRGHGHFLARGADPRRMMAELFGKADGYSGGRGGSQLMADYRLGFLGANGITGAGMPVATGAGLSLKLRRSTSAVLCFFGDGAASQGTFHESLNMAALWKLPVIYLCENNLYAMSTPVRDTVPVARIADRAAGYGIPGITVDGNDLLVVYDAIARARRRAVRGEGPSLVECMTYRLSGHSRGDPRVYRSREEEAGWLARDPIRRFKIALRQHGRLTPADDRRIRGDARRCIREAEQFARRSPYPDPATLEQGVFA